MKNFISAIFILSGLSVCADPILFDGIGGFVAPGGHTYSDSNKNYHTPSGVYHSDGNGGYITPRGTHIQSDGNGGYITPKGYLQSDQNGGYFYHSYEPAKY